MPATIPTLEVLIVGAGPTGLTLACELARRGIPFQLIDKKNGPSIHSKALALHARTLEILERMGIVDEFLLKGLKIHDANLYADGKRLTRVTFDDIDSGFPFALSLPQQETEQILVNHLEALGYTPTWETSLVGVSQTQSSVLAQMEHPDGTKGEIASRWLVACDGANSFVRNSLGLPFDGSESETGFILADARVRWSYAHDEIHTFFTEHGFVGFIPLPNGLTRVVLNLGEVTPSTDAPQPDLHEVQQLLSDRGLKNIFLENPAWISRFYVHYRMVKQYRDRRVFLAGDSAHIHSPIGGQGMNTGIQDAINLVWKLELVSKGWAKPALLDTYHAERHGIGGKLLETTEIATRVATLRHPVAQAIRNGVAAFLTSFESVQQRFGRDVSMLALNYRHSPAVAESRPTVLEASLFTTDSDSEEPGLVEWRAFAHGPQAGERAPDWGVQIAGADKLTPLLQVLRGIKHHLLLFDGFTGSTDGYLNLRAIAKGADKDWGHLLDVHVILPAATIPAELQWSGSIIMDTEGDLHRRYGAASECLYLIRPDGYIGFRCQPAEWLTLKAYLERWFMTKK